MRLKHTVGGLLIALAVAGCGGVQAPVAPAADGLAGKPAAKQAPAAAADPKPANEAQAAPAPATNPPAAIAKPVETAPKPSAPPTAPATQPQNAAVLGQAEAVDPKVLPKELQGWALGNTGEAAVSAQVLASTLYLRVDGGEQPSGGYRVEIRKVELADGVVRVQAVLHKPAPGSMVTQALTYPKGFAKVSYTGATVPQIQLEWLK